jgi:serine protease Do
MSDLGDRRAMAVLRNGVIGIGAAGLLLAAVLGMSGCAPGAGSSAGRVTMTSFAPLVQQVLPAVVNVSAVQRPPKSAAAVADPAAVNPVGSSRTAAPSVSALEELLRRLLEQQERKGDRNLRGLALGSGFVIDPRGYIVTDDHVLENVDSVTVTFHDGIQRKAQIVGRDALTDLALLKVEPPRSLSYVTWGDSDAVRVGDWVLAIGNPFGLDDTVSSGIISARGRDIHSGPYDDFLQIDASINRGNSGGPTFDLDGKVIGINSAIYSPNGGSVGIGFAIPANLARPVVEQLMAHGKVERGWLGVQIQPVTAEIAESFGLSRPAGALVAGVSPGGPAARAGFARGDVILSVNGRDIERMRDLPLVVAEMPVGRSAEVTVWRLNQQISLRPVIGLMPAGPEVAELPPPMSPPGEHPSDVAAGLRLGPLTPSLRQRLHVQNDVTGIVVTGIAEDSPPARAGLLPGDVIVMVGQTAVATPEDVLHQLRAAAASGAKTVIVLIDRHGSNRYLALSLTGSAPPDSPGGRG